MQILNPDLIFLNKTWVNIAFYQSLGFFFTNFLG